MRATSREKVGWLMPSDPHSAGAERRARPEQVRQALSVFVLVGPL
jgi:hypothetical protein